LKTRLLIITLLVIAGNAFGQVNAPTSFKVLNKGNDFISFSFGMGANYSNNPSLLKFIESDIEFYNNISPDDRFSTFEGGLEFFSGIEYQVSKNISLKGQYSFLTKSFVNDRFPNYDYSYVNHQPYLLVNYIIPQDHSFIKIGAGAGYIISNFSAKKFGAESKYSASGPGIMTEGIANLQISKNVAGYISLYAFKTFTGDLESETGVKLSNTTVQSVSTESLGGGVRLGMEIFIF
jgi:hypothetical protein